MDFGTSFRCVDTDLHTSLIAPDFVCKKGSFCNYYAVSPAPESGHGFRQILVKHFDTTFWYRLGETEFKSLVFSNFPVHEVLDWTPEEAEEISLAFCPSRQSFDLFF